MHLHALDPNLHALRFVSLHRAMPCVEVRASRPTLWYFILGARLISRVILVLAPVDLEVIVLRQCNIARSELEEG